MKESVSIKISEPKSLWSRFESVSRREHGSTAWASLHSLRQPQDQDGTSAARDAVSKVTDIGKRLQLDAFGGVGLLEPEDARLTGGTRSLVRRLMGLNISPRKALPVSAKMAARPAKKIAGVSARVQVA